MYRMDIPQEEKDKGMVVVEYLVCGAGGMFEAYGLVELGRYYDEILN